MTLLKASSVATVLMSFAYDKVQVLEDLEALITLLSSKASVAECTASSLQKHVTSLHAAADQSSKDQAACDARLNTLKKEAGTAKRVLAPAALLCIKCSSASMMVAYQASDQTLKKCINLVLKCTCPVTYIHAFLQTPIFVAFLLAWSQPIYIRGCPQELTVARAELSSAKSEGSKYKSQCNELQSQNATLSSELRHSQQDLTAAQVRHVPSPFSTSCVCCNAIAQQRHHTSSGITAHHRLRIT